MQICRELQEETTWLTEASSALSVGHLSHVVLETEPLLCEYIVFREQKISKRINCWLTISACTRIVCVCVCVRTQSFYSTSIFSEQKLKLKKKIEPSEMVRTSWKSEVGGLLQS